jgi:hypothetical protein
MYSSLIPLAYLLAGGSGYFLQGSGITADGWLVHYYCKCLKFEIAVIPRIQIYFGLHDVVEWGISG